MNKHEERKRQGIIEREFPVTTNLFRTSSIGCQRVFFCYWRNERTSFSAHIPPLLECRLCKTFSIISFPTNIPDFLLPNPTVSIEKKGRNGSCFCPFHPSIRVNNTYFPTLGLDVCVTPYLQYEWWVLRVHFKRPQLFPRHLKHLVFL